MLRTSNSRIAIVTLLVLGFDQLTKFMVKKWLPYDWDEKVIVRGFFKFVHWSNTGAAWSMFKDRNGLLAIVALIALFMLYRSRHHFSAHTVLGQLALGLVFGGIIGNLIDRLSPAHSVTDFLYFHLQRRGAGEIGFPAFNIADSAICIGVGLFFILSWKNESAPAKPLQPAA